MATPGKGGLQMPGSGEGSPGAGARTPGAGVARLDEKSSTAPAGYAQSGIISRGAGAGGGGSVGRIRRDCQRDKRKSAGPVRERRRPWRPYGKRLKENGRRIRLWPARGPFRPIGHGPEKGRGRGPDIRRPLRARKRRREVAAPGSYGRGAGGVRFGDAHKQSSWVSAKAPAAVYTGDQAGGITGGKRFAGGSLGVPGANRYASAARAGVAPELRPTDVRC